MALWKKKPKAAPPGSDADMLATLARLGIPANFGTSDPMAALTGGFAKATLYQAHLALQGGDTAGAIAAATTVIDYPDINEPAYASVLGAAHTIRGSAHEQSDDPAAARADYTAALEHFPAHPDARAGLDRLEPRT